MALILDTDRQLLTAQHDKRIRKTSSSSSSRSGASSRDSSENRTGAKYKQLRKQSSPAFLTTGYSNAASSTPSPLRSGRNRSQSVKNPSGHRHNSTAPRRGTIAQPYTLTFEDAFRSRGRTNFSSNDDELGDPNVYRLRNFAVTPKGAVKNRGDSYRPRSNTSVISSLPMDFPRSDRLSGSSAYSTAPTSLSGETTSSKNPRYRVLLSGGCGVGKTALTNQFLTSEYMNAYDTLSTDYDDSQDTVEKSVSVLLDGQESELDFLDPDSASDYAEKLWEFTPVDAHVIVYNIVDRATFEKAIDILFELRRKETSQYQAIILVGNKSDLVKARTVSTDEGKSIASSYDCKFIETSAGLNHNVDELLVGILTQIRLKEKQATKKDKHRKVLKYKSRNSKNRSLTSGYDKAIGFLSKLLSRNSVSKSCGNLHVI